MLRKSIIKAASRHYRWVPHLVTAFKSIHNSSEDSLFLKLVRLLEPFCILREWGLSAGFQVTREPHRGFSASGETIYCSTEVHSSESPPPFLVVFIDSFLNRISSDSVPVIKTVTLLEVMKLYKFSIFKRCLSSI